MVLSKRVSTLFALVPFLLSSSLQPVYAQGVASNKSISTKLDALSSDVVRAFQDVDAYQADFKRSADTAFVRASISYAQNLGSLFAEFEKRRGLDFPSNIESDPVFSELVYPLMSYLYQEPSTRDTAAQVYDHYRLNFEQRRTETLSRRLSTLRDKLHVVRSELLPDYIAGSSSDFWKQDEFKNAIKELDNLEHKLLDIGAYRLPVFEELSVASSLPGEQRASTTNYQYEVQHGIEQIKKQGLRWTAQFDYLSEKFDEYNQKLSEETDPVVRQDLLDSILLITRYFSLLNKEIIPSQGNAVSLPELPKIDNHSDEDTSFGPAYLPYLLQPGSNIQAIKQPDLPLDTSVSTPLFKKFQRTFWYITLEQFQLEWAFFSQARYQAIKDGKDLPAFDYSKALAKAFSVAQDQGGKTHSFEDYWWYADVRDYGDRDNLLAHIVVSSSPLYALKEPETFVDLSQSKKNKLFRSFRGSAFKEDDLTQGLRFLPYLYLDNNGKIKVGDSSYSNMPYYSELPLAYDHLLDENKLVHNAAPYNLSQHNAHVYHDWGYSYRNKHEHPFVAVSFSLRDSRDKRTFDERYPFSLQDADDFLYAIARLTIASKIRTVK